MGFIREEFDYTKFNIENHKMDFAISGEDGVLISIPFTDDTPKCIKDKLNDIIYQEMNKCLETVEYMPILRRLMLNASMQVQCYNDEEFNPKYYIAIVVTEIPEIDGGIWIEKTVNIFSETYRFRNEFISYCQYQVNKILFPVR